ncbi:MAG: DNA polymerase IV [Eubacteriaceae bacterium]|nr:DNA polymerase IV [Eubacteriaceae bacterium]
MEDRVILHCDMNGFFASVELLERPDLKNVPMAVCGNPENRHGIILAKNEPAKKLGVVTAETIWQARQKCPDLVCVPPHMRKYKHYSRLINEIYGQYTDMVEPFSIDESWLDVTGSRRLFGTGEEIGNEIRSRVRNELGLTLSVGVSFNKIFAKMGSEYKKPDATTVISRENYRDILWPLPAGEFFFVGKATAAKLKANGIKTIGDIAQSDITLLTALLGKMGGDLFRYANGLDDSPVAHDYERRKIKSVGNGITFRRNLETEDDIRVAVIGLADRISARLRKLEMKAGGIKVDIKDPSFKTISRQIQLEYSTDLPDEIAEAALDIIHASWRKRDPIRLLTITGINLSDGEDPEQISLFGTNEKDREKSVKVARTIDDIRDKYGSSAISFGRTINNDLGVDEDPHDTKE